MSIGFAVPAFTPAAEDPCFCGSGTSFGGCCGKKDSPRRPPHGVRVLPRYLDTHRCAHWVKFLETRPRGRTRVLDLKQSAPDSPVYVEDPARVCDDVDAGELRPEINAVIAAAFTRLAAEQERTISWFETPRILRYRPGGYYIRHSDSCQVGEDGETWFKVEDRDLSLLLYINDDYSGGGLSFTRFNCHFTPRPGDLLAFPSDNRYEHQAEVVRSGFRYAIASWAAFEGERRVRPRPPGGALQVETFEPLS